MSQWNCQKKIVVLRFEDSRYMKYALITGASSGIGLEFARQLAERAYGIVIVSNRSEENLRAASVIRQIAFRKNPAVGEEAVKIIDMDLTLPEAAAQIYSQVQAWGIEVEILVSNAGMLLFSTLTRTAAQKLDQIIALHCSTPAKLVRLFGQDMQKRRQGYILLTSSMTAWMPYPTISHYGATKAFLKNFARSVWYEFRPYGIGVTALFPGAVDTPLYNLDASKRRMLRLSGIMQTPEKTVSVALRKLFRKRHRCIPGFFTRLIVMLCVMTPAWVIALLLKLPVIKKILAQV